MTKEELASKLNSREIGSEITKAEEAQAKENRLVVIFGASDDLCELRGAIKDEVGAYGDGLVQISREGVLLPEMEDTDEEVLRKYGFLDVLRASRRAAIEVKVWWCVGNGYSWSYETQVPHATFEIMEGTEKYCRGIVIDLKELF